MLKRIKKGTSKLMLCRWDIIVIAALLVKDWWLEKCTGVSYYVQQLLMNFQICSSNVFYMTVIFI